MIQIILLLAGFLVLIKGADFLVDGAASIAKRMNISDLVIGLTVVSFGTSAPELFVNIVAAIDGKTDMALGNIIGSNISNILLILGVSALIYPLPASRGTVWKEIPFGVLAALILCITANDRILSGSPGVIDRGDGLVLLCFFLIFLYYSASIAFNVQNIEEHSRLKTASIQKSLLFVALGFAGLVLGGWLIVENAVIIAKKVGMSEAMIGLTIVAIGTSLPELATSAMAAYKRNTDIAVGNVVGSNIFNIFLILGVTASARPIPFNSENNPDLTVMFIASGVLFLFMFTGKKNFIDRWEGGLLLMSYAAYLAYNILKL